MQRFDWFTERSVKRSADRVMILNQVAQLLGGAVFVWLLHFAPLLVNGFTVLWLVVALVNVGQLAGRGWRWWCGRPGGDEIGDEI